MAKARTQSEPGHQAGICGSTKALADLLTDKRNANRGTKRGAQMIERSLREYGAGRSILLDRNGRIIAGNKTAEQAANAGMADVMVIEADGTKLIAVQRMDLDLERDGKAKALAIADNRAGEVGLNWDAEVLEALDHEIELEPFFSEVELRRLIGSESTSAEDSINETEAELDALRAKYSTAPGQVWLVGPHRVVCGDSADGKVAELAQRGLAPALMVTDPPYGVNYDPQWRVRLTGSNRHGVYISDDERWDWSHALAHFRGDIAYLWHGALKSADTQAGLESLGFDIRCQIVWAKERMALSRGHYSWQHEPCWYAVRKGATARWRGGRCESSLWEVPNIHSCAETGVDARLPHAAQKPVELYARPMRNHTDRGDAVYDPFLGSGTSIVAAHGIGRVCCGVEIEPRFVALILERATSLGLKPARET